MDTEKMFKLLSDEKFLRMEGLGNEVPFFIHTYDIREQDQVFSLIDGLAKRLTASGAPVCRIGLYDMVISHFEEEGELEELFRYEKEAGKREFLQELVGYLSYDEVIRPYFRSKMEEDDYRLMFVYQIGEVFPYLRTHDLLNRLQSVVTAMPLVLFFPGEYITSYEHGFTLNLFGRFEGPYYRAFKLEDYLVRGNIG
jgi:hypothetical protein